MKTATGIFGFWVVLMLHTAFSDSACDVADSRVRRYVSPKRVLWKSESPDKRFGVRMSGENESVLLDPACAKPVSSLLAWSGMHEPRSIYTDAIGQNGHNGVSTFYGYYVLSAIFTMAPNAAVSAPLEWPFVEQHSRI